jgi:hypothetical protein
VHTTWRNSLIPGLLPAVNPPCVPKFCLYICVLFSISLSKYTLINASRREANDFDANYVQEAASSHMQCNKNSSKHDDMARVSRGNSGKSITRIEQLLNSYCCTWPLFRSYFKRHIYISMYLCVLYIHAYFIYFKFLHQTTQELETLLCELRIHFRNEFLQTNLSWKLKTDMPDMLLEEKGDISVTHSCQHYEYTGISCKKRNRGYMSHRCI